MFGGENEKVSFVPYAVRQYLKWSGPVMVIRILQDGGYNQVNPLAINISGSWGQTTVAVIHPSATGGGANSILNRTTVAVNGSSASSSFAIKLSGSLVISQSLLSASLNPSSSNYITNVYGLSAQSSRDGYVYMNFPNYITSKLGPATSLVFVSGSTVTASFGTFAPAATPWITSQLMPGTATQNLFKVETIADGTPTNRNYKVSILNTAKPGTVPGTDYGQFTLLVRDFYDTDKRPTVLETWPGLTLDPNSANYIARKIGDNKKYIDNTGKVTVSGSYANKSKRIRVVMNTDVDNGSIAPNIMPRGFAALTAPYVSGSGITNVPTASYVTNPEIASNYSPNAYYGFDFSNDDNLMYCAPIPTNAVTQSNVEFNLDYMFAHASSSAAYAGLSLSGSTIPTSYLQYSIPLQGGFDGRDPATRILYGKDVTAANLFGYDCSTYSASGSAAYRRALNTIQNPNEYDINLIVMPGVTLNEHNSIITYLQQILLDREDTCAIIDQGVFGTTVDAATVTSQYLASMDANVLATYYPWIKVIDTTNNKPVWVPPSVGVAGAYAFTEVNGESWDAPAGTGRGKLDAVDVEQRLTNTDKDNLYSYRVNPIMLFASKGIIAWGNKNLQAIPSALDRVNVMRALLKIKKDINNMALDLVFDNNTSVTRNAFMHKADPYMRTVKQKLGVYDFRIKMDDQNNTADIIDEQTLYGQIWLKLVRASEFIKLDFNIMKTGANFSF